jgi:hypothetical protein
MEKSQKIDESEFPRSPDDIQNYRPHLTRYFRVTAILGSFPFGGQILGVVFMYFTAGAIKRKRWEAAYGFFFSFSIWYVIGAVVALVLLPRDVASEFWEGAASIIFFGFLCIAFTLYARSTAIDYFKDGNFTM